MSTNNKPSQVIDVDELVESVGDEFLKFLSEEQLVSESFVRKINALVEVDMSAMESEILTEAERPARADQQGVYVPSEDIVVGYEKFASVWQDYDNYPQMFDVLVAFGVPRSNLQGVSRDNLRKRLERMRLGYQEGKVRYYSSGPNITKSFNRRKRLYAHATDVDPFQQNPTQDDLFPGQRNRRNKTTTTLDRINAQEILPGEFYANMTRIPKQRWGNWLRRLFRKQATSVKPNPSRVGMTWQKHFLMGYQTDKLFFEIWYNTLDGTFMLHDKNGAEMGRPVPTLQEAMRYFIEQVRQSAPDDVSTFQAGGVSNQLSTSMLRGIANELSKDSAEAERKAALQKKSERDIRATDSVQRRHKMEKTKRKLKRDDRKEYIKGIIDNAMEIPTNLQRSAYIRMMNTSDDLEEKMSIALRTSFNYAMSKAKDERELQGIMINQLRDHLKDDIDSVNDIIRMGKEFLNDPEVRAEVKKKLFGEDEEKEEQKREEIRQRVKDAEEKFRKSNEKRIKDREEKQRKARERSEAQGKKALGDKFDVLKKKQNKGQADELDRARSNKQSEEILKKYKDALKGTDNDQRVSENFVSDSDMESGWDELERELNSSQYDNQVKSMRNMAERSGYTQAVQTSNIGARTSGEVSSEVMQSLLSVYTETKATQGSTNRFVSWFKRKWFRGRRNKVILPTDPNPVFDRIRQSITGKRSRADFVIGYSLGDKVNLEIWYVTELGDNGKLESSFYVYDISSQSIVRRYLPYYRSAVQVVLSKIGLTQ